MPWKIPGEQKIFRHLTEGKVVAMGCKTFESIGKPLPNRHVIITRQTQYPATGCYVANSFEQAIAIVSAHGNELFVAGGAEIYIQAMALAHGVYLSEVHRSFEGDAFFPAIDEAVFALLSSERIEASIPYTLSVYERRNG